MDGRYLNSTDIKELHRQVSTPYKLNKLILSPSYIPGEFDSHAIDAPFIFEHEGTFYMTYIGFDTIGYQTGLASSNNLLNWKKEGLIVGRGKKGSVNEFNVALTWILCDNNLFGRHALKKINGLFLGTYHSYPSPGYEEGAAVIGLCWSHDLRHWQLDKPVLFGEDGGSWERGGLYKSCIIENEGTYYLFYNAKDVTTGDWHEQTGVATSRNLVDWERYKGNPIIANGKQGSFDQMFSSDPCVFKMNDVWTLFYFGVSSDGHARDGVAFSKDLLNWQKSEDVLIDIGADGNIDSLYAHKPFMFYYNRTLYHFYTAVSKSDGSSRYLNNPEIRGITVAASRSLI